MCLYDAVAKLRSSDHRAVVGAYEVALRGHAAAERLVGGTTRTVPRTSSSKRVLDITGGARRRASSSLGGGGDGGMPNRMGDAGGEGGGGGGDGGMPNRMGDDGGEGGGGGGGGGGDGGMPNRMGAAAPALTRRARAPSAAPATVVGATETQVCAIM